jgi:hypothetical protein
MQFPLSHYLAIEAQLSANTFSNLLPPNNAFQPTGRIGAILTFRSSKIVLSFYQCELFRPAAER